MVTADDDMEGLTVTARWRPSADDPASTVALDQIGPTGFVASIGPWSESGPHQIQVTATDAEGETAGATANVRAIRCPIGDFVISP